MHSSILGQIMSTVWNWFTNFYYSWDGTNNFTIYDYFVCMCMFYIFLRFIFSVVLFARDYVTANYDL